ncbi:hypothetical protein KC349_g5541 [Hortaea werneckii]|nr:hypothetical protein KC349_g5541 [Hortaea werneckii]
MCLVKPTLALATGPPIASGPAPVVADGVETASLYASFTVSGVLTPSETANLSAKRVRDFEARALAPTGVSPVCTFNTPLTGTPYCPALSTASPADRPRAHGHNVR